MGPVITSIRMANIGHSFNIFMEVCILVFDPFNVNTLDPTIEDTPINTENEFVIGIIVGFIIALCISEILL